MKLHFLPPENIMSVVRKQTSVIGRVKIETDFLLRALRVVNSLEQPVEIMSYTFTFLSNGHQQSSTILFQERVKMLSAETSQLIGHLSREGSRLRKIQQKDNLHRLFGTDEFWIPSRISNSNILEPDEESGLFSVHFRVTSQIQIDELMVDVMFEIQGKQDHISLRIPIIEKQKHQDYLFPVRGKWIVGWNWVGFDSHRDVYSQEFALDIFRVGDRPLKEIFEKPNTVDSGYGEEIIAIADGTVTSHVDNIPDNPSIGVEIPDEEIKDIIDKNSSSLPAGAGNHVVLKHKSSEHSFYAHMIPGSLRVKTGDRVKQGQVLGLIGNSGNSDGPHLHFHLMDGPDYFTARGLPCHFMNVRNLYGELMEIVDVDSSPVWAE
jgi:hypothetical protein